MSGITPGWGEGHGRVGSGLTRIDKRPRNRRVSRWSNHWVPLPRSRVPSLPSTPILPYMSSGREGNPNPNPYSRNLGPSYLTLSKPYTYTPSYTPYEPFLGGLLSIRGRYKREVGMGRIHRDWRDLQGLL